MNILFGQLCRKSEVPRGEVVGSKNVHVMICDICGKIAVLGHGLPALSALPSGIQAGLAFKAHAPEVHIGQDLSTQTLRNQYLLTNSIDDYSLIALITTNNIH